MTTGTDITYANANNGDPPNGIWQALDAWGSTLQSWQRSILSNCIHCGTLAHEHIEHAYQLFLRDNGLRSLDAPALEEPASISGRPSDPTPEQFRLVRIQNLQHINALPPSATLTFAPSL